MEGTTPASFKAMPAFKYAVDNIARCDQLVASARRDIAQGRAKVAELETMVTTASADTKTRIGVQVVALQNDAKSAESQLSEMKYATAAHWKEFEAAVASTTTRLRKSIQAAVG